jgi:uncharacterized protein YuzE
MSDSDRISAHYDHEANALYIALTGCSAIHKTLERDEGNFDLDADGAVVGIEILNPPRQLALAPVAAELGFADLLDRIYRANTMARGMSISEPGRLVVSEAWA